MNLLNKRENKILVDRQSGKTLQIISNEMLITRERVRQIEQEAISKLFKEFVAKTMKPIKEPKDPNRFCYPVYIQVANLYIKNAKDKKDADEKARKWEKDKKPIEKIGDYNAPIMKLKI